MFKPKELVEGSEFELKYKITNKTGHSFPGGIIKENQIITVKDGTVIKLSEQKIPEIPAQESRTVDIGRTVSLSSGLLTTRCKIVADDGGVVNYYQKNKLDKNQSDLLDAVLWQDFMVVSSRYELNQKYTNYLLSAMTLLLLVVTIIQLFK
ncbi:hypothetical protein COY71_02265 [Candidatus Micrarchaeota archaeon CG_4_10_14_0_8_um_filter_60_7]|nr:MAG: hypothetical protein COT58_01845 [Candidatus Micrarchaeota archaeon CG09_land_8_20_14_0_10_60_16]PIY91606.1 MAG: hypothetical protein COY71_02265 [Candidatus Micrarchaeota archaeon CG_4_10_14_0_8_um_filter_60_7]